MSAEASASRRAMVSALSVRRSRRRCSSAPRVGGRMKMLVLPVDLQQDVVTGRELFADLRRASAVVVIEYLRVLEESLLVDQFVKPRRRDEIIISPLDLLGARLARGVRHRHLKAGACGQQAAH
jgi:hypothetical protein